MEYILPKEVQVIFEKVQKARFKVYLVGGSVRDLLLNREVKDWDFTTDAKPEEILKLFPDGFYDNKFGTVGIPIRGDAGVAEVGAPHRAPATIVRMSDGGNFRQDPKSPSIIEVTTMRKEGDYKDFRHPVDVSWTDKIEEDLARRDFTVNAIALDFQNNLVDPFNGQEDLKKGLIRAVGNPTQRFNEDALRLIRAIRLATQLNFEIDPETLQAIKQQASLIQEIAHERIRDELFKLLGSENSHSGVILLRESDLLKEILPELEACFGIVQEGPKHDRVYDIGEHSLLTLKFTPSNDPLVKFSALLHDIGKVKTVKKDAQGNVTFFNHDRAGADEALKIAQRFNLSKKQTDKLYRLIRWHMFTVDEHQTDSAIRRFIKNVGVENLSDIFALREGDRLGGGTPTKTSWRMEKFQERIKQVMTKPFSVTDLKINGRDVMEILNIKPSRKVGEILDALFEEVLEDSSKNTKEYLSQRVTQLR